MRPVLISESCVFFLIFPFLNTVLECFVELQGLFEIIIPVIRVFVGLLMPLAFMLVERADMVALGTEFIQRVLANFFNQRDEHVVELK